MAATIDLNLIPYYRIKGQEWPQLPGLLAIHPPRHPARGREDDHLIVFLTLAGNMTFTSAEYNKLVNEAAKKFYQRPGTVTSALRAAADSVNQVLVERNMRTTGKGIYVLGRIILAVLRDAQLFLAQSGATHVLHLTGSECRHIHEGQIAKNGLGMSQTAPVHFAQEDLQPGDVLALCMTLPPEWEEIMNAGRGSFEVLRRKLLPATNDDLNAVLVEARAGKGILTVLPGVKHATGTAGAETGSQPAPVRASSQVSSEQPASRFSRLLSGEQAVKQIQEAGPPAQPVDTAPPESDLTVQGAPHPAEPSHEEPPPAAQIPAPGSNEPTGSAAQATIRRGSVNPQVQISRPGRFVGPRGTQKEIPEISRAEAPKRQQAFRGLAKWLRGMRVMSQNAANKTRAFLPNLLPDMRSDEPRVSGTSMMFVAIAIPLLVVMAAMTFYNKHGKTTSYQENYNQAWAASLWAADQTNPADMRVGWERTLYYLGIADDFMETDELIEMRLRAQTALDNLDSILRLDFNPALYGGLSQTVQVAQMAATNSDLYLLDADRGSVQRFFAGSQGYLADTQFTCGPGSYEDASDEENQIQVGKLIAIRAAPRVNAFGATLIGMDSGGNLLFCHPSPVEATALQLPKPDRGWWQITGFTIDLSDNYLYVLDSAASAVWYYKPNTDGIYDTLPRYFFGTQVPVNMENAIDLATNGADMYLLFNDGHVTACPMVSFDNTTKRCNDPVQFIDNRPEHSNGITIAEAHFTQMIFAEAPDQALYLFDPLAQAIYRFSPRPDSLILQGQFRAAQEDQARMFATTATAMTISPNRYIFISVNGQVHYSSDVP